jgi:hypothetical protein
MSIDSYYNLTLQFEQEEVSLKKILGQTKTGLFAYRFFGNMEIESNDYDY